MLEVLQSVLEIPAVRSLRARVREATYDIGDKKVLYNSGGDVTRLAEDLYAVIRENHTTGSSNLENDQIRQILTDLHTGREPSDAQYGVIQALERKYSAKLKALRASPDHQGQDYSKTAPEGAGRIVK